MSSRTTARRLPIRRWGRWLLAGVLVILLSRLADWGALAHLFAGLDWRFVGLALLLQGATMLLGSVRWHIVLKADDLEVPIIRLVWYYWVMLFFGNFVPSMVGGDVVRMVMLNETRSTGLKIVSVLIERLFGLIALLTFAAVILVLRPHLLQYSLLAFSTLLAPLGAIGLLAAVLIPESWIWAAHYLRRWKRIYWVLTDVSAAGRRYRVRYRAILATALISITIQVLVIISFTVRAQALHLNINLAESALVVPIITLLALVPVTPGGWGTNESLYIVILGTIGLTAENALAIALLVRAIDIIFSAGGGLLWALDSGTRSATAHPASPNRVKIHPE